MTTEEQSHRDGGGAATMVSSETFRQFELRNEAEHKALEAKVDGTKEVIVARMETLSSQSETRLTRWLVGTLIAGMSVWSAALFFIVREVA